MRQFLGLDIVIVFKAIYKTTSFHQFQNTHCMNNVNGFHFCDLCNNSWKADSNYLVSYNRQRTSSQHWSWLWIISVSLWQESKLWWLWMNQNTILYIVVYYDCEALLYYLCLHHSTFAWEWHPTARWIGQK